MAQKRVYGYTVAQESGKKFWMYRLSHEDGTVTLWREGFPTRDKADTEAKDEMDKSNAERPDETPEKGLVLTDPEVMMIYLSLTKVRSTLFAFDVGLKMDGPAGKPFRDMEEKFEMLMSKVYAYRQALRGSKKNQ